MTCSSGCGHVHLPQPAATAAAHHCQSRPATHVALDITHTSHLHGHAVHDLTQDDLIEVDAIVVVGLAPRDLQRSCTRGRIVMAMRDLLEGWADTEELHSYPGGYQHRLLNAVDDLHAQIEQWAWADLPAWPDL